MRPLIEAETIKFKKRLEEEGGFRRTSLSTDRKPADEQEAHKKFMESIKTGQFMRRWENFINF